jgi:glucosyl-3-phosphoglycerate synthase
VAIAERYDHKHQPLEPGAADRGLARMGRDIAFSLFSGLASQGQVLDLGLVRTVVSAYQRIVLDLLDSYAADAAINGLRIDRGAESLAVDCFTSSLFEAGQRFVQENSHHPLTPTWDEVLRLQPDALERLQRAVSEDRTA